MDEAAELTSIKPRSKSRRQGLRNLSPDLIGKARDETAAQVTRVGLTFVGTSAFCVLSLQSPDSALLDSSGKIIVPFAGPVSFLGFMLLGPAVLIVLRAYLQIYVEHGDRLDRLARSVPITRAPMLLPVQNALIRPFSGLIFYMLLPVVTLLFAWKAAVFPGWGLGLLAVAAGVITSHVLLPFSRFSWRSKGLLSVGAAIILAGIFSGGAMLGFDPLHRPFNLFRANLSGQWLSGQDLRRADLSFANLSNVNLNYANLSHANLLRANLSGDGLRGANLTGANLIGATLSGDLSFAILSVVNLSEAKIGPADLEFANLSGAYLGAAKLSGVNLIGAGLSGARLIAAEVTGAMNLTQRQLDEACGDERTKLPAGLTIKLCAPDR